VLALLTSSLSGLCLADVISVPATAPAWQTALINLAYLAAAVLFILGLKGMTHPATAVRGNLLGAVGMLIAVVVTLFDRNIVGYQFIIVGIAIGTAIGWVWALRCQMTAMPQLVALLNGFGGAASVLVAASVLCVPAFYQIGDRIQQNEILVATAASGWIGAITFWGSLVAFAKLEEFRFMKDVRFSGQQFVNAALAAASLVFAAWILPAAGTAWAHVAFWLMVLLASVLGVGLVISIGGADMPVVIALFNSYSGLAAAATGFVLSNNVLIISGSLVGASGIILTQIMCKGMNRSLTNVLFGKMEAGPAATAGAVDEVYARVKSTTAEEVGMILDTARRVVVVPGYGMAVSQAQHAIRDLTTLLNSKGITVEFAIHPVAGRMPGHMNVLLAEADIPYELLKEMDEINPTMGQADVVLIIGANDVVNPLARTDPRSPIAGMPIIDADKARTVVVIKRSLSPGFAGIPNPLFAADNALLLFADARKAIMELIAAVEQG
jgi:NAD(P) transhydrogenase subunit beta